MVSKIARVSMLLIPDHLISSFRHTACLLDLCSGEDPTPHRFLEGRGVGKSFIAKLLAQYLQEKGVPVRCFDADPVNNTLAGFPALNTTKLDLIESSDKGRRINPRRFDDLVEQIAGQPAEAHVIVDTGSSAFVPLLHYVVTNEVPAVLSQSGGPLLLDGVQNHKPWRMSLRPIQEFKYRLGQTLLNVNNCHCIDCRRAGTAPMLGKALAEGTSSRLNRSKDSTNRRSTPELRFSDCEGCD